MKATPQIYVKGSDEAAVFYQEAFGLNFGMTSQNPDGTYEHVSLMSGENEILAIGEDSKNMHGDTGDKVPQSEGGYGKPLGNKNSNNVTGLLKIKLLKLGIRVVYKLVRTDKIMKIIVVAARADDEVYEVAAKRIDT